LKSRQRVLEIFTIKEFIHKNDIDSLKNYAIEEDKSFTDLINDFSDGKKDGDNIHGVIHDVGLSNDGRGKYLLVPNEKGQILAIERAYRNGNINPLDIDYIECHATGTPLGDLTEINSIDGFFNTYHNVVPLVGAIKSNVAPSKPRTKTLLSAIITTLKWSSLLSIFFNSLVRAKNNCHR